METQGVLVESLDESTIFAELNSGMDFNPASVIKVATSFAALRKFGPDYRFETAFYTNGRLNKKTHVLEGDLVLFASGDPVLTSIDLSRLARAVAHAGIRRITGNLIVSGTLTYGRYSKSSHAVKRLSTMLRIIGVRVPAAKVGEVRGNLLVTHVSKSLKDILFYQNAHSINMIAERLGEVLGGPKAVERFLIEQIGIPEEEVYVSRTSGLGHNRITPRGTVQLFRELLYWLNLNNMEPQDILPVAGIDPGTLRRRFASTKYRGGIIGKTGTLPGTDGGVSTLAGIAYTRNQGPILFAIFNTKGSVLTYRRLQDSFLKKFITEFGGIPGPSESLRRSSN